MALKIQTSFLFFFFSISFVLIIITQHIHNRETPEVNQHRIKSTNFKSEKRKHGFCDHITDGTPILLLFKFPFKFDSKVNPSRVRRQVVLICFVFHKMKTDYARTLEVA